MPLYVSLLSGFPISGFRNGFVNATNHVKGGFRQVIQFPIKDHLETLNGVFKLDEFPERPR